MIICNLIFARGFQKLIGSAQFIVGTYTSMISLLICLKYKLVSTYRYTYTYTSTLKDFTYL